MAIFTNDNKSINGTNSSGATIIAPSTHFKGVIDTKCHLHIEGDFEGDIKSSSIVIIGKDGKVTGMAIVDKLVVSGHFKGEVEANVIEILPQGRIEGIITSKELVIERAGVLIGESRIKGKDNAVASFNKQAQKPTTKEA